MTYASSAFSPNDRKLAVLVGAIDASVVISYLTGISPPLWHIITLIAKLLLWSFFRNPKGERTSQLLPILLLIFLAINSARIDPNLPAIVQAGGVIAHLSLTLALVSPHSIRCYFGGIAALTLAGSLAHIVLVQAGQITANFGRYYYLGNSHPNLGGEMNAIAAVAIAMSCTRMRHIFLLAIPLYSCVLMQSRAAALVVILSGLLMLLLPWFPARGSRSGRALLALSLGLLLLAVGAAYSGEIWNIASNLFRLSDPARGLGSGFVGREGRWQLASTLLSQAPWLGVGLGYFEAHGLPTPHNFLLYLAAQGGVLGSAVVLVAFAIVVYRSSRSSSRATARLGACLPLLLFNDRFLNINPYPFALFAGLGLLASLPAGPQAQSQGAMGFRE